MSRLLRPGAPTPYVGDVEGVWMIIKTTGVCGGSACVRKTRIPVWSITYCLKKGWTHRQIRKAFPAVTEHDISQCQAYYKEHKEEIDQDILENGNLV